MGRGVDLRMGGGQEVGVALVSPPLTEAMIVCQVRIGRGGYM
jgi:hypothetical protein